MAGLVDLHMLRRLPVMALAGALFVATMFAGALLEPDPVRRPPVPNAFDVEAAQTRLARILGDETPHPVDSPVNDDVRERLLAEIRLLGFSPEVRDDFSCRSFPRGDIECARVRNVVFSAGPADGPAVLAAAHYDSVPAGPGASDDGIGVAAWLEVASRLRQERLERRVIFLFTDGEEMGLLGAHAFASVDPLYRDVEAIVNLEARGSRGPAWFFETNRPNADAVTAYSSSVSRPVANSIAADVYRLLPNSTDVTALTRNGVDVINIALIDGFEDYHTPADRLSSQDPASLQHMGDQALSLVRSLASRDDPNAAGNQAFTDVLSRWFISLPENASRVVLALSLLVAGWVFWRSRGERPWLILSLPIAALVAAGALGFGAGWALTAFNPRFWFAHPELTRAWTLLLALSLQLAVSGWIARGASVAALAASGAFTYVLVGTLGSLALGGLSILFLPSALLFAAGGIASAAWRPAFWIGLAAAALFALLLWAPLLTFLEIALGYDAPFVHAVLFTLMLTPWLGLLAAAGASRWLAATASVATLSMIVAAGLSPAFTEARPQGLNIVHFQNLTNGEARFAAGRAQIPLPAQLAAAAQFTPELLFPGDTTPVWTAPAPPADVPGPEAQVISISPDSAGARVSLSINANGAYHTALRIPSAVRPRHVTVNDAAADVAYGDDEFVTVGCSGRSCANQRVEIVVDGDPAAGAWYVSGFYVGSSAASSELIAARPRTAQPIQMGDGIATLRQFSAAPAATLTPSGAP